MALQDGNGVFLLYTNDGNIRTNYNDRGERNDLSNPPVNCEFTMYVNGGGGDDCSAKHSGGRHSDSASCDGCCYIPACPDGGGSPRCRTECPHPSYGSCSGVTNENNCVSYTGTWRGLKLVVWNTTNNCRHWELWQDQGNSSSSPANQWVRLSHSTDCNGYGQLDNCGGGPLLRPRGSSSQFTWRCDSGPNTKWKSAVGLVAGNSAPPSGGGGGGSTPPPTDPGTGGSGPGTPGTGGNGGGSMPGGNGNPGGNNGPPSPTPNNPNPGDGGGGAGNDNRTGTGGAFASASGGCAIARAGNTVAQAGRCPGPGGGTGTPDPSPGDGGGVGGATEPKPIVTVYKDLAILYNIRTDLFDNCTISGDPNITNFEQIYSVSPVAGEYRTLFQNSTTTFVGTKLHSSQSALYNKKIRKVTVTMKKSTAVALTGNLVCQIRDRNGNLMTEFDTVIDPATLTLNDVAYDFEHPENDYALQAGDMILVAYADGGDTTNHVLLAAAETGADQFDGFNTVYAESASGLSYDIDQLQDFAAQIFI